MAELIALRDIVKVYGTTVQTTALRGISFSIAGRRIHGPDRPVRLR